MSPLPAEIVVLLATDDETVSGVCVSEVADLSVPDGETVLVLVSKKTEMRFKVIQNCLFETQQN